MRTFVDFVSEQNGPFWEDAFLLHLGYPWISDGDHDERRISRREAVAKRPDKKA